MNIVKNVLDNIGEMVLEALSWALAKTPFLLVIITPVCTLMALWQATRK